MSIAIYFKDDHVTIDARKLSMLKEKLSASPLKRARFCLHKSPREKVQEMLIAICKDTHIRPHRQKHKRKTYTLIEGRISVAFFGEDGQVIRRVELGPASGGGAFLYTFPAGQWHTVCCLSETAVYLETLAGPYVKAQTEFAPWEAAPEEAADGRLGRGQQYLSFSKRA
ncbi:MAG: hypothetical protein KatS3mg131_1068 [Candidatus Tectimicrobiota bacterium]|nr:MAG: hypothetical protein KatS3mg131_1068 [Candidatus Tectomicrobia bacterium]